MLDSEGVSRKYRSNALKKTYAFNEKGEIIPVDSYTDEQILHLLQHITLSKPVVIFWCFDAEVCYGGRRSSIVSCSQ
jgi:hypothetical protein